MLKKLIHVLQELEDEKMPAAAKAKKEDKCIIKALMDKVEELKFENLQLQTELDKLKEVFKSTKAGAARA